MAWAATTVSAGEQSALAAKCPLFIAKNALDHQSAEAVWSINSTGALTDVTDDDFPAWQGYDGQPHTVTRPTNESDNTYYYTAFLDGAETIDAVAIQLANAEADVLDVTVRIADSFSAGTNVQIICRWADVAGNSRLLCLNLDESFAQYTTVPEIQVQITRSSGTTVPSLAQFFAGRRRQLSRAFEPPYDPKSLASGARDFSELTTLARQRDHAGLYSLSGSLMATDAAIGPHSLNDTTTLRGVYDDSKHGRRMIVYCEYPNDVTTGFVWGYVSSDGRLEVIDYNLRQYNFSFDEVPPTLIVEPTIPAPATGLPELALTHSLAFDGVGERVLFPADAIFNGGMSQFTVIFWVKLSATIASSSALFNLGTAGNVTVRIQGAKLRTLLSTSSNGTEFTTDRLGPTVDGLWHWVAVKYAGLGNCTIYLDGVNYAQQDVGTGVPSSVASNSGTQNQFPGVGAGNDDACRMCCVMWFSEALDEDTILEIGGDDIPHDPSTVSGIEAFWLAGTGDTFATATDSIGGFDGVMTSMESGDIVADFPT